MYLPCVSRMSHGLMDMRMSGRIDWWNMSKETWDDPDVFLDRWSINLTLLCSVESRADSLYKWLFLLFPVELIQGLTCVIEIVCCGHLAIYIHFPWFVLESGA